ncbi:hypothetical protein ACSQ67_008170 [Phaseolus vulgaris]
MSVIVRNEENQLLLLCKGADSVMFERLSQHGRQFEVETRDHIKRYAEAGLRTLVVTYRELDEEEYKLWDKEFSKVKSSVTEDRDALVDAAADKMERDLILLGATAVEDRLQKGASLESIKKQIGEGISQINSAKESSNANKGTSSGFGLIIDGKSLDYSLNKNLEKSFFELAINCASVICCRSSPKQKARAIMASDFAIAQFRFLERLLLICYFFYKNIAFGFTLFWFEAYASFSGQAAYNDWYMSFYNVFFTSLPVIALGVFDQDVSAKLCLKPSEEMVSIAFWYVFVLVYGYLSPAISTTAYRVFVEACAPSGLYWLVTLLVVVCVLLPYFSYRSFQSRFLPMYHDIIQREQVEGIEIGLSDDELPKKVQGKLIHLRERLKQREL